MIGLTKTFHLKEKTPPYIAVGEDKASRTYLAEILENTPPLKTKLTCLVNESEFASYMLFSNEDHTTLSSLYVIVYDVVH